MCAPRAPGLQGAPGASGCAHSTGKRDPAEPDPKKGTKPGASCMAQLEGEARDLGLEQSQLPESAAPKSPGVLPTLRLPQVSGPAAPAPVYGLFRTQATLGSAGPRGRGPAGWLAGAELGGLHWEPRPTGLMRPSSGRAPRPRQQRAAPEAA